MMLPRIPLIAALLTAGLLTGCQKDTDPGPGGVTVGEARALDEAAAMLETRPGPPLADATVPANQPEVMATTSPAPAATAVAKPVAAPQVKPGAKAAPKPKPKPAPKSKAKPAAKSGAKGAAKSSAKPAAKTAAGKTAAKPKP